MGASVYTRYLPSPIHIQVWLWDLLDSERLTCNSSVSEVPTVACIDTMSVLCGVVHMHFCQSEWQIAQIQASPLCVSVGCPCHSVILPVTLQISKTRDFQSWLGQYLEHAICSTSFHSYHVYRPMHALDLLSSPCLIHTHRRNCVSSGTSVLT